MNTTTRRNNSRAFASFTVRLPRVEFDSPIRDKYELAVVPETFGLYARDAEGGVAPLTNNIGEEITAKTGEAESMGPALVSLALNPHAHHNNVRSFHPISLRFPRVEFDSPPQDICCEHGCTVWNVWTEGPWMFGIESDFLQVRPETFGGETQEEADQQALDLIVTFQVVESIGYGSAPELGLLIDSNQLLIDGQPLIVT